MCQFVLISIMDINYKISELLYSIKNKNMKIHTYLIIASIIVHIQPQKYPTFEQYTIFYKKSYASPQQQQLRRNIYNQNIAKFAYLQQQMQFKAGVNKFTDRTQQELQNMKNGKIKPLSRSVTSHHSIKRKLGGPSSLDWRTKGGLSSVKDQGWCGSCWAFATAAYCESSLIINNGYNKEIDLSQQYLLQCTQQSDCKGGYPAYALLQVATRGIPKQQAFAYNPAIAHEGICQNRKNIKIKGKQVYVYFVLSDLEMIYLLQTSPVIVGVGSQDWEHYQGGIMKCRSNVTQDHAVLLVGYTTQYWIVKNSWGPGWGEQGYIRISRNKQHNCLMGIEVDVLSEYHLWQFVGLLVMLLLLIN